MNRGPNQSSHRNHRDTRIQIYSQTSPYSSSLSSLFSTCAAFRCSTIFVKWRESMGDHFLSLQHDPGNLLGQVGVHSVRLLATPETHNFQGPYVPDSLWCQYLTYVHDHVRFERIWARIVTDCHLPVAQEMPFVISDRTSPRTLWSQSVDGLTARSPILSQGQIPEKPRPLVYGPCNGNGNFNNQAGPVPNCCTQAGYNQVGNSWSDAELS